MSHILVVDDDPDTRRLIRTRLEARGHTIIESNSGGEGVNSTMSHHPDAVLMDIRLVTMDGLEAVAVLRRLGFKGAVIAVTALSHLEFRDKALAAGCDDFVHKPIGGDFGAHVDQVLASHSMLA